MNILEIQGLCKRYGDHTALDGVNLNVPSGAVFGLLGPNGAGKTTLLRIINSILVSDSGTVTIDGHPASLDVTSRILGYMPEERGLYPKMRVDEQILYFGKLKGQDMNTLRRNMQEYMDIFNIAESDRHRKVEELSKGNQQKVQIIATLVHEPKLIILDEPFSGFDPINGQLLQSLIERLKEKGSTIILSSHNMPAIEEMCTHIALINRGQLLLSGELEEIKEKHRTGRLLLCTSAPLNIGLAMDSGLIESMGPYAGKISRKAHAYSIMPRDGVSNNDILGAISIQASIVAFEELLPSLSELFISYTGSSSSKTNE